MRHELPLQSTLPMEIITPALPHILLHHFVIAATFIFEHADNPQYREFFLTFRLRIVQIPN
ncbi:hypothetical protein D3C75_704550 [compost metagenome]